MTIDDEIKILTYNLGNSVYGDYYSYKKDRSAINFNNLFPSPRKQVINNISGSLSLIKEFNPDIILLQEISKISISNKVTNPYKKFKRELKEYKSVYYSNYNILNILNHGKSTFSKDDMSNKKIKLKDKANGFLNNFFCSNKVTIASRFNIEKNNKQLVIFNVHFAAFKKNFDVRVKQMQHIFSKAKEEYEKGNYVVIGGDWNMHLPNQNRKKNTPVRASIPRDILSEYKNLNWQFAVSDENTLRSLDEKYSETTHKVIFDGFLCSPNINIITVKGIEDFRYSDHAPVMLTFKLKSNI